MDLQGFDMEWDGLDPDAAASGWTEETEPERGAVPGEAEKLELPGLPAPEEVGDQEAPSSGRQADALSGEFSEFLEAFPEVKGEDIPPEVWKEAIAGKNLTLAYSLNRTRELEQELAARRQAEDNRMRSTGSLAKHAPGTAEDLIAAWWNEA